MREKIYSFIRDNKEVSIHVIAEALAITELKTLKYVNSLYRECRVELCVPIPLENGVNDSCRYRIR